MRYLALVILMFTTQLSDARPSDKNQWAAGINLGLGLSETADATKFRFGFYRPMEKDYFFGELGAVTGDFDGSTMGVVYGIRNHGMALGFSVGTVSYDYNKCEPLADFCEDISGDEIYFGGHIGMRSEGDLDFEFGITQLPQDVSLLDLGINFYF